MLLKKSSYIEDVSDVTVPVSSGVLRILHRAHYYDFSNNVNVARPLMERLPVKH